jgi:hypothetical protein
VIGSSRISPVKNMEFCNSHHAENSRDAALQKLDTHFIDRSSRNRDILARRVSSELFPGRRMRSTSGPAVGDMRKRMTRRCVSAATGACR